MPQVTNSTMKYFLDSLLTDVQAAIELHQKGLPAPFSIRFLGNVKTELEKMAAIIDPRIYRPSYPRFVLDWPEDSALGDRLLSASDLYGRIRPKKKPEEAG